MPDRVPGSFCSPRSSQNTEVLRFTAEKAFIHKVAKPGVRAQASVSPPQRHGGLDVDETSRMVSGKGKVDGRQGRGWY